MKHLSPEGKALGFRIHAAAFVIVMLLLAAINLLTGPPYWVLWVLPGWSIGLLSHWWFVLGPGARGNGRTHAGRVTTDWRNQPEEKGETQ
jgi:hypothetical protein